jgi:hypothetical protein
MPYIKPEARPQWAPIITSLVEKVGNSSGRLRYLLCVIAGKIANGGRYANYERAMGFLTCLSHEFDRRLHVLLVYNTMRDAMEFDLSQESIAINTNFVHGISKEAQGGHMNYLLSSIYEQLILRGYFEKEIISAVMRCAIDDFYYKEVAPYEDKKISENGDVYFESLKNWYEREGIDNGEEVQEDISK